MTAKRAKGPTVDKPVSRHTSDTVTCTHCRYERPAADKHCHICGYPWSWLKPKSGGK